ncbi:NAD-dependent epimerase [Sphaerochaeta sp.]|uniref:NAD-dependent epimerase n=1 Tax=Sphaerochaeta sp. TaxID=1972642 RepID=UPI003D0FBA4C
MKILLTGAAGFIGFHTALKLLADGHDVIGLDSINDYYSTEYKYGRLFESGIDKTEIEYNKIVKSSKTDNYSFIKLNLEDKENLHKLFEYYKFDKVCNLAAQAGVRYSIENPYAYINSNIVGFVNIIEGCRHFEVKHLIYASSSSVYGKNTNQPFSTSQNVDHPMSLYAATKKTNELIAHTYSHLYGIQTTGLRFFTVYGPWGRPDMAMFKFADLMRQGKPIDVYNFGKMERDFTYIDDIVEGVCRIIYNNQEGNPIWNGSSPDPGSSSDPYKVYNIGNNQPVQLLYMIETLEKEFGIKAEKNLIPLQPGDVPKTFADVEDLVHDHGYKPSTSIEEGIAKFVQWYKNYNNI